MTSETTEPRAPLGDRPEHHHGELRGEYPHLTASQQAIVYVPEEAEALEGMPCFAAVRDVPREEHPACKRPAAMYVYGRSYCEVHGAEVRAGALVEMYHHASEDVQRLYSAQHVGKMDNRATVWALEEAAAVLEARCREAELEEEAALLAAWPFDESRMDDDLREWEKCGDGSPPEVWLERHRLIIHKHIRLAFEEGAEYILEGLFSDREQLAEQLAYVLALYGGDGHGGRVLAFRGR